MSNSTGSFSAPPQILTFDGLLSDFDGTIVDSTDAIVKHWHKIGAELGVDPATILATSHGRRSIDTLQLYDPTKANWEYVSYVEGRIPQEYGSDAVEIPGARSLLSALDEAGARWGVVTSGTRALLEGWLGVLNLTHPDVLVVAEDVELGKPDPRCYLLGRTRLGLEHSPALVVLEDAPSGIKAGKAAGFTVIALTTTHTLEQLQAAGADVIIEDLRSISVKSVVDGRIELEVRNAFEA
ncbi:HAD family hydrolase [Aspergillus aculeatinus CBS 121060]|uniref:HAD-like protein n=3 Tax=Aspergillus TaxID=5052 RepID=A0A8G1W2M2_9EURO|nr:HAD-like protein [Aspergillus brunneoviolaceus CBS 621.78]XP_025499931.1 HAD-like protein [Aspergillus aculeatinus CBS 121060]XP_040802224.1 HAD-like protein [Aspergillus fijiensis CBS 313.89]RAH42112.1 HAD-like protein [Aspergillus brunneoviolaceus CBS 621.78]RAH66108.1 HAD-like protein [Aspergillus aculeatinus CBS 121060]RAK78214.1 HAD-like protein [Aspergillus fijiensis CBS 313.89]